MEVEVSDRVEFRCNGVDVSVAADSSTSLLSVLREQLGLTGVKDGCAPQGQCGCCTVLVDGAARVSCVTPVSRVAGREVTTPEGLDVEVAQRFCDAFVATGGSQCGFCTPGILMRAVGAETQSKELDARGLAAHLCRCTGWQTIDEAVTLAAKVGRVEHPTSEQAVRDLDMASRRATLEGGAQRVARDVPFGGGGFADDSAPRDALVAVPLAPGATIDEHDVIEAVGLRWVIGESLDEARHRAAKVQGRRTTIESRPPLWAPVPAPGGVALATGWVEPAYLEPDASWCAPGAVPADPLANAGAFGGKVSSLAPDAARELADRFGRVVRVVYSREDVVRLGPKRPPVAATAFLDSSAHVLEIEGRVVGPTEAFVRPVRWPYRIDEQSQWATADVPGPPTSDALRAVGLAERAVLLEGAIAESGVERQDLWRDERVASVALDTCVDADGALAGARLMLDESGIRALHVRVAAGDPLDEVVLRSFALGATHMAIGWVCTEGIAIDDDGNVADLTIRSFGVIRAAETPTIDVEIVDDAGPPLARSSDAVFAAVAAATWNAIAADERVRPATFPATQTRIARTLRR